jgi:nuclear polyadenylated RNA-binding protein 3
MEDASLSIPRRDPRDAPDVQIILLDQLDPQFVSWVEKEMQGRGVKVEVMFLSPRLPLQAVIRRQILEGVHAVSKLDMRAQNTSKVSLQVFDRQGGINNIRFDEYQDLEPKIAAELTLRTKNSQQPQSQNPPAYSQPFPTTQPYQQPAPVHAAPTANLASLVGQLDNATLQKILGSLSAGQPQVPPQQQNSPTAAPNSTIDLAGFLGGFQQQQQQQPPQQVYTQPQPMQNSYPMQATNQGYGLYQNGLTQQQQQQQQPTQQSAQQVQNIMAQLARFRQ